MKERFMAAVATWAEKRLLRRVFEGVWFKRWRWVLVPLAGLGGCVEPALAQSFVADVDYQLQRQYKGPLLRHEVFTNAAELAAYVGGGAASRAYAGQVVVLVEGGEPVTYTLGMDGTNMVAHQTGAPPEDWSVYPAAADLDMGGHSVTGAADVVTADGVSLTNTAAVAAAALPSSVWASAPGTTNYMPRTEQVLTNAALQSGINARVPSTDARYLASLTNAAAFATAAQGARADLALTNQTFGVTETAAYRGDWGQAASNLAYAASTSKVDKTDPSYSRTSHGHGNLTSYGSIGGTAGLLVQTTTSGLLTTKPAGTTQQWLRGDGQWSSAPTGWHNPAAVSYWTYGLVPWGSEPTNDHDWTNRVVVQLTSYTGPPDVVIPDYIDGHPVAILQASVYASVFTDPGSILTITAGRNLDYIGAFALANCASLYRVDTPGVTRIGEGALYGCSALETVHLPNTLTYLEGSAFYDMPSLQAVYWGGDWPSVGGNNPFGGSTTQAVNYVTNPTATGWGATLGTRPVVRMDATVGALTLGGVRRTSWPGHYWPSQTATYKEYKFPAGDYLFGDGTNLFYVTASGAVTNAITANP